MISAYNNAQEVRRQEEVNSQTVKQHSKKVFGNSIEVEDAASPEHSAELMELSLQERKIAILEQYTGEQQLTELKLYLTSFQPELNEIGIDGADLAWQIYKTNIK